MTLLGAELGADKTWALPAGRLVAGLYAGYGRATQDFKPRAGTGTADGESAQLGGGLYAAWLHPAGWFANLTLAAARYDNAFTAADQSGNPTTADYRDHALGASLELGRRLARPDGWFVEPAAQLSLARLARADYRTAGANRLDLRAADATLARLRATLRAGRAWPLGPGTLELAARAAAVREDSSGGEIRLRPIGASGTSGPYRPNLDGPRAEAGAGLLWRPASASQVYFDYEYAAGDAYEKPWSLSLGYRHDF
jgi:outer membrane autotransporter protein